MIRIVPGDDDTPECAGIEWRPAFIGAAIVAGHWLP